MNKEFQVPVLSESGLEKARFIADAFDELLDKLDEVCESCRELAITRTKLEEACFFATKAMLHATGNTESKR